MHRPEANVGLVEAQHVLRALLVAYTGGIHESCMILEVDPRIVAQDRIVEVWLHCMNLVMRGTVQFTL